MNHSFSWTRIILLVVLGYEALGALVGGALLMVSPDGRYMEMPVHIMHGTFHDFLIPGLLLFALGILNAFAFVAVLKRIQKDWFIASLAMGGFYTWFVVEIIILKELHWLHLMWGLPVLLGCLMTLPLIISKTKTHNILFTCGMLSSAWYILINILVPFFYEGYSMRTFTISELSAIGAPTRTAWVLLATPYPLLIAAFGLGILNLSKDNQRLKVTGTTIIIYSLLNLFWPPMHMRGTEPTFSDTLHITWASLTVILMVTMMISGAQVLDKRFRTYTLASLALLLVFGVLTFLESPNIATNELTPTIGMWERINVGIFMLWILVLSIALQRSTK